MASLILNDYKRKEISAYVVPVFLKEGKLTRGRYIKGEPLDEVEALMMYRGKLAKIKFELGTLPDGVYEYGEASSSRPRRGYILLSQGEVVRELDDPLEYFSPLPADLPPLEGSPKQIAWAQEIRAAFVRKGYDLEKIKRQVKAEFWINNRHRL